MKYFTLAEKGLTQFAWAAILGVYQKGTEKENDMKEVKLEVTMSEREYDVFVDFIHHGMYDLERIMEHEQDDEKWQEMKNDIDAMNRILQGVKTQMKGGE